MTCELCGFETHCNLCEVCREFLKWRYPEKDLEEIVAKYKKEFLKGRNENE